MLVGNNSSPLPVSAAAPPIVGADKREQPRSSMFLACLLRTASGQVPVRVRNMSPSGALVEGPLATSIGSTVQLIRGSLQVRATVAWSSDQRCGLRFASEVVVAAWLKASGPAHQGRVDELVTQIRGGAVAPVAQPACLRITPPDLRSPTQLVGDLQLVHRLLERLEDELTSDSTTLARHGLDLQKLDIGMQMLRAIAADLSSSGSGRGEDNRRDNLRAVCGQALGQN
jgi:hypothetical protein